MSDPRVSHPVLPLIEATLNGTIDDAGFAQLDAALREDTEARAIYRSMVNLHAALPGIMNAAPRLSIHLTDRDGDSLLEPHDMPHDQLIGLLAQVEAGGENLDPMALAAQRFPAKEDAPLTKQDWAQAGRYLLGQVGSYRQQAIMGAAAAVMLLAAVLFLTWGSPSESSDPIASIDPEEQSTSEDVPPVKHAPVATLTSVHDAQWQADFDFGTPVLGELFYPGRLLTLTQGLAEITTNRGAVVLIQAPATVAFTHDENAISLHSGRLVGSCRTDRSKGFTVNTRHADVVDLGTEFGVEVTEQGVVTSVYAGKVEVTPAGGVAEEVVANQTARLSVLRNQRDLVIVQERSTDFTQRLPRPALVTSVSINDGRFKAELVPQGVVEDAKLFTDREHEINGLDLEGIPSELLGGDLIKLPASARPVLNDNTDGLEVQASFAGPSQVYLLFSKPEGPAQRLPDWIAEDYEQTALRVGIDYGPLPFKTNDLMAVGVGPGVSIDKELQVWKRKQVAQGRATIGGRMIRDFTYSLIAVPQPQGD